MDLFRKSAGYLSHLRRLYLKPKGVLPPSVEYLRRGL
jgi:hypothetical protein